MPLLEDHGVEYWIEGGTALGAHRDGRIIQGDFDVDVDAWTNQSSLLRSMPWAAHGLVLYEGCGGFKIKTSAASDQRIDVFLFDAMPDGRIGMSAPIVGGAPTFHMAAAYPRQTMEPSLVWPRRRVVVEGLSVWAPGAPEAYLTALYGADWRVPRSVDAQRFRAERAFTLAIPWLCRLPLDGLQRIQHALGIADSA